MMSSKQERGIRLATSPALDNGPETGGQSECPSCKRSFNSSTTKESPTNMLKMVVLNGNSNSKGMMPTHNEKPPQPVAAKGDSKKEPFKFAGYLGTMAASLLASLGVLCLKLLPVENNLQEAAKACMIRGVIMTMFCSITIVKQRVSFMMPRGEYFVNISRALLGATNTFLVFVAVQFITMGEVSALKYSSPVWTCLLGFIILREPVPMSLLMGIPLSLLGIILLAYPSLLFQMSFDKLTPEAHDLGPPILSQLNQTGLIQNSSSIIVRNITELLVVGGSHYEDDLGLSELGPVKSPGSGHASFENRWPGIAAALGSSLCIASSIIVLKFRKTTPIATNSFYMGVATAIVAFFIQLGIGFGAPPATLLECVLHVGIGFFAFSCQCMLQWSLQFVPAGSYSVIRSLDIVIGFVLGALILDDVVLWTSIAGSILIMIVVSMLILNDYIESVLRWMCCFNLFSQLKSRRKTQT